MRITTAIIASLTVILATGCAVEAEETDVGVVGQGLTCQPDEGIQEMAAALAVAIGRELQRWDGLNDFAPGWLTVDTRHQVCNEWACWWEGSVYTTEVLKLSAQGESACGASNCPTIRAILAMQTESYFAPGVTYWNGPAFASRLVAGWRRLASDINNLKCQNFAHSLAMPTAAQADGCGQLDFSFEVVGANPSAVECQMALFTGGGDYNTNPWINFRVADSRAIIDPTDSTVSTQPTPIGICWDAPTGYVYDPLKAKIGQCCVVAGVQKALYAYNASWDKCR